MARSAWITSLGCALWTAALLAGGEPGTAGTADDLVKLGETLPGAARTLLWSKAAPEPKPRSLSGGNGGLQAEAGGAAGVDWPISHVTDRAVLHGTGRAPRAEDVEPQVFDGETWRPIRDGLKSAVLADGLALEFRYEPLASTAFRFYFKNPPPPLRAWEVFRHKPAMPGGRPAWPERLIKDNLLEKEILARAEEPSFEALAQHGLSMPVWALMGIKDWPHEQPVSWDGRIKIPLFTLRLRVGAPGKSFAEVRDTVRRELVDGWRPGVIVSAQFGSLLVRQTSFVTCVDDASQKPGVFVRYEVRNGGSTREKASLTVNLEELGGGLVLAFENQALRKDGHDYLVGLQPCRVATGTTGIACDLELAPGETKTFDLAAAVNYRGSVPISAHLREVRWEEALKRFRAYWDELLKPAAKIRLPEERLNRLVRAALAQFLVNADGNVMPYGAMPSQYEGSLYGVEEGYVMLALGMFGLGADAQRYMDGTYLTPTFLRKVEKYKAYDDRHQQYRNGLQPMYAVHLYRLTRDQAWIRKHLPLLKTCAEWTLENRKKTMVEEQGQKPLHWGLLPKWSYGGDVADNQCYALYANLACFKGLLETSWLLGDLGDAAQAKRYADEARAYRGVLENVLDRIYRPASKPPFLPLDVYGSEAPQGANGEYYQLFAGLILDLLPFDFKQQRVNYLTDFLEQDNRLFCLLPRFRRDAGPGGLDAIYGLGYILTKLFQDRTREFLLGFYGYQVFNLEHTCFTSRETNVIYASDEHLRTAYPVPDQSDPLPCSTAVIMHLLRHMLVTEEFEGAGEYSGALHLLLGAPRKWFRAGQTIAVEDAPTHFGKVSFKVVSRIGEGVLAAEVTPPTRNPCKGIRLRLRHPEGKPLRSVTVNGQEWKKFDAAKEWIDLPGGGAPLKVEARY